MIASASSSGTAGPLGVDPGEVGVQPGEDLLALLVGEWRRLKGADADGLPVRSPSRLSNAILCSDEGRGAKALGLGRYTLQYRKCQSPRPPTPPIHSLGSCSTR